MLWFTLWSIKCGFDCVGARNRKFRTEVYFDVVCTVHHIAIRRWPTRCTVLINSSLFHSFLSALHVSNESSRSSSRARHNILYHAVRYNLSYNLIAARLACTIIPNCVIQSIRQCSWWWTNNSFETCRAKKNSGIKIMYKNCASRWSFAHYKYLSLKCFWICDWDNFGEGVLKIIETL